MPFCLSFIDVNSINQFIKITCAIILFMSSQLGGTIKICSSFDPKRQTLNNYRSKSIESNAFSAWASNHMYKSSYAHFHSKDSTNPKTDTIPGYQGFIPQYRSESLYGKRMTDLSKDIFGDSNYGKKLTGLSSNGFNVKKEDLIDQSKGGSTSKYGRSSWLKAHPAWQAPDWKTTTQNSYVDPRNLVNPTYRKSNTNEEYNKLPALSSGFSTNRAYWDGTGWNPEKILKPENISTEYRNIFNPQKPIHRDANVSKARKLNLKQTNYKFNF